MSLAPFKEFKSLTVDYAMAGTGTATVGVMVDAFELGMTTTWISFTLVGTTGQRTSQTFDLEVNSQLPEGTMIKLRFACPAGTNLKVFGAQIEYREFGLYLRSTAANLQHYETPAMGVGN